MKFRIFYKFLIAISIFTLFPLIWLGSGLLNKSEEAVKTATKEMHLNLVESFKTILVYDIVNYKNIFDLVNKMFGYVNDWGVRQGLLDNIIKIYDGVESISVINLKGEEVVKISSNKKQNLSKLPSFAIDEASKNKFSIFFETNSVKYIFFQNNYFIAVDFDSEVFYTKIFFKDISKASFFIFDKLGNFKISKNKLEEIDNDILAKVISSGEISSLIKFQSLGVFEKLIEDKKYLGAVCCVEELKICIGSIQKSQDAYSYVDLAKKQAIITIFLAVFISLIGSYLLSKMLIRPLLKFIDVSKRVADKDFSARVEISTNDELEELRDTFNKMIEEIEKYSKLQIERILKERKNVEAVMYSTEEGMIMVDKMWQVQLINRKALSLINASVEDEFHLIGKDLFSYVNSQEIKDAINLVKSGKNKIEISISRGGGVEHYRIEVTDIKIKDRDDLLGYLITFYDITYDKQLEKMKDDFLHSITHDLRNPVSAIKGFSEFLLKEIAGPLNQNQKNMIVSIDRAAFRLLGMINNILDIAKMESGKMELSLTRFNVVEIIHRCVDLMKILGDKKNISFVIDAPNEIFIVGDVGLIERVYINLIGNSIKFTPQDGTITIAARIEEDMFKSWVEDTGEGIPLEYIDKVFEKFEQVKGQKGGGTGLGLTICKYVVEAHLGRIWAEWRANMGAKIVFSFPMNLSKDEFGRIIKVT
ncbi:MAG: ATP-binding protein [Elusimicrobiales bacterium]|nr:ATP-binding protein [Elusimicrobiales bacterium]